MHTDNWIDCVVEPRHSAPKFSNFHYDALSPEDIIISKITRFDDKDRADIEALMRARGITKDRIGSLFDRVVVPPAWRDVWQKGLLKWDVWNPEF